MTAGGRGKGYVQMLQELLPYWMEQTNLNKDLQDFERHQGRDAGGVFEFSANVVQKHLEFPKQSL